MASKLATAALSGASATAIWQAVRLGLILLSVVILSRLMPPESFGLLAMVTAIVSVGEIIRDFGLSAATLQAKSLSPEEKTNLFWINVAIGGVLSVVAFLASWGIAALYSDQRLILVCQAISITLLMNGIAAQFRAQVNRDLRFNVLGMLDVIPQAIGLAIAIGLGLLWRDERALIVQQVSISATGLVLAILLARWRPTMPRRVSVRHFISFGANLAGTQVSAYLPKNADTVALGLALGAGAVGLYARAYQLILLPLSQLTAPLSRVAIPILARVHETPATFEKYLRAGQFAGGLISGVVYGLIAGLAAPMVEVLLGPGWAGAVPLIQALAIGGCFRAMGQVPYWIFVATGRTKAQLRLYLVAQPLLAALIVAGVIWGALGVAVAGSVGYAIFWFAQVWWAGRYASPVAFALIRPGLAIFAFVALPVAAISYGFTTLGLSAIMTLAVGAPSAGTYAVLISLLLPIFRRQLREIWAVKRGAG
jgi:O-antigen/teichoic acid export membrane protein